MVSRQSSPAGSFNHLVSELLEPIGHVRPPAAFPADAVSRSDVLIVKHSHFGPAWPKVRRYFG